MNSSAYRIIIADNHSLIRKGLRTIIELESDMQIVGEAADGLELLDFLSCEVPDMVILDISMPRLNGLDAIARILTMQPHIRILILTMHKSSQYFFNAIEAGAHGYLVKDDSDTELLNAIRRVRSGRTYVSPLLAGEVTIGMISAFRERRDPVAAKLTPRERDVLNLVVKGYTSKQIAKELCLSPRTIEHHRARLRKKFNMKNTVDLVNFAIKNKLVSPE